MASRAILWAFLFLTIPPASLAAEEPALWAAPLTGDRTLETAWQAGAVVRDAFPDAILAADPHSARVLAEAGFAVEGPFAASPGATVTLLRARGAQPMPLDLDAIGHVAGVRVLWENGRNAVVESRGPLPPADAVRDLGKKVLATRPLRVPSAIGTVPESRLRATTFNLFVDEIAAQVDSAAYFPWLRNLAGANPVVVDGQTVNFVTRYTYAAQCDTAEQYVYERFVDMGFPVVEYDEFLDGDARNVIATLPGSEAPDEIYILCGHLDSTSPNPHFSARGGNDNASGTAAVLVAAEILKDYEFRATVKFIAFTGEEQGLYGSEHYASEAAAAGDDIRGVVNCDMVAWFDNRYDVLIEGVSWANSLMQVMNDACAQYTTLGTRLEYFSWGSDHVPFQQNGFPAFLAIERDWSSYPCYHQTCDTANRNYGVYGAEITRACIATVAHLATPLGPNPTAVVATTSSALLLETQPNPFVASTSVRYAIEQPGDIDLAIYDVAGRRIRTLFEGFAGAGAHNAGWDGLTDSGGSSPAGIYFLRLEAEEGSQVKRIVRLR